MARYQFTAAATRAVAAARRWTPSDTAGSLSPAELLLGLLDEAESRAAEMLAARGIDTLSVLTRWPTLARAEVSEKTALADDRPFSPELQEVLAAATSQLADIPQPFELATEHLLLGLVAAGDELADWLAEQGFDADVLAHDIRRLYGYGGNGEVEEAPDVLGEPPADGDPPSDSAASKHTDHVLLSTDKETSFAPPQPQAVNVVGERDLDTGRAHTALLRLIDAAANRAREGLRVQEDFVRFAWNDRHLMAQLKQLRHDLVGSLARLSQADLVAARDTPADVGTTVSTEAERERADLADVVTANAKRLQESLRSIEEYGKVLAPPMSAEIEQLRYRAYTLERALAATSFGLARLTDARLYVLIDGGSSLHAFGELARTLVKAGVEVLQLRDKRLTDRELLARAHRLRELTLGTGTLFIMNDRPDLAVLAQADGVHVGQEELSVGACRSLIGPRMLIGLSTHSLEQARQAVLDGANYIGVGPTFASRTKPFDEHHLRGPDLLRAVQAEVRLPAFAIGGIDRTNLAHVLATGFTRVAVSGAILSAEDPARAVHELAAQLRP